MNIEKFKNELKLTENQAEVFKKFQKDFIKFLEEKAHKAKSHAERCAYNDVLRELGVIE